MSGVNSRLATRLLLVEDDERIRQAVGLALAYLGFEVVEAASGEAALQQLDQLVVDVVLLDLMLPGIDGLTVCRIRVPGEIFRSSSSAPEPTPPT